MIEYDDVRAAAAQLKGQVSETPFLESRTLSKLCDAQIFLKFENLQFTASFKERGVLNKLISVKRCRPNGEAKSEPVGVVAMSAGNHAQSLAYHAQRLNMRAVVVMPRFTPAVKVERTRSFGAQIVLHGDTLDEAREYALALAEREHLTLVHPYDDEAIVAGQGTVGIEMLQVEPDLDALVAGVGGGGLIAGIALVAKALKPSIEVVGVQMLRFPSMFNAIKHASMPQGSSTIAEGIAVGTPGKITQCLIERHVDDIVLVDEGDIEQAIVMLLEVERSLVEGAGAAGLAALLKYPDRFRGRKVGIVLSGGNIDPVLLATIVERGLIRAGRLARVRVSARDVPGSLALIASTVAGAGANINEVHHQRGFTMLAIQNVEIELVLQTRGNDHTRSVLDALNAAGFQTQEDKAPCPSIVTSK